MTEAISKNNRSFWIVFAVLIGFAAVSTIVNISEYRKMDRLNNKGTRIMVVVDTLVDKGSKKEIFVRFNANGKQYTATKKVKTEIAIGDSVPVHYLPDEPEVNAIAVE